MLEYKYPYAAAGVKSKSAVSDFKGVSHGNAELMRKPSFLKEKAHGGADYGTAMHLILEKTKSYALFASEKEGSDDWNDKMSDNLIYQFIYRNWYGLGLPDIFPKDYSKLFLAKLTDPLKFQQHY